jgi:hypothetical protein
MSDGSLLDKLHVVSSRRESGLALSPLKSNEPLFTGDAMDDGKNTRPTRESRSEWQPTLLVNIHTVPSVTTVPL